MATVSSPSKTNAVRLLDTLKVAYSLHAVAVDEQDLSAVRVAQDLGEPVQTVYKTLVARGDKQGVFMVCIMADAELDLKKAAKATGNKSVTMVALKEVLPLTGYMRGGCSPLATKKSYAVYVDEHAILEEYIYINGGQRGLQIRINPHDLIQAVQGSFEDLLKFST